MGTKIKAWLGLPALVVGVALSLGTIMNWFGVSVKGPTDQLTTHIEEDLGWKETAIEEHQMYKSLADTLHDDIHDSKESMDEQLSIQQTLIESLVIRTCIRDDYDELVLQRLLSTCRQLGVVREPDDQGARALTRDSL